MRDQLKMSWVTLDRFCEEEAAKDESLRRKLEADHRPLRSSASTLTDDELLGKLGSMGFELDCRGVEDLCAGALSAEEVAHPLHKEAYSSVPRTLKGVAVGDFSDAVLCRR
jgi:hypothetical protein